jgi:hypothetical protein
MQVPKIRQLRPKGWDGHGLHTQKVPISNASCRRSSVSSSSLLSLKNAVNFKMSSRVTSLNRSLFIMAMFSGQSFRGIRFGFSLENAYRHIGVGRSRSLGAMRVLSAAGTKGNALIRLISSSVSKIETLFSLNQVNNSIKEIKPL